MDKYLKSIELDLSDSVSAARQLLGYKLVVHSPSGIVSGYIVETEAYHSSDPASHSYRGPTKSNESVFLGPGTIYIYFTYGMHYCLNIVTGAAGDGQAVLIRAIHPLDGLKIMRANRGMQVNDINLTNGPAKLTKALGVHLANNGQTILDGPISIEPGFKPKEIVTSKRVGISKAQDNPWRFYVKNDPYVSKLDRSLS